MKMIKPEMPRLCVDCKTILMPGAPTIERPRGTRPYRRCPDCTVEKERKRARENYEKFKEAGKLPFQQRARAPFVNIEWRDCHYCGTGFAQKAGGKRPRCRTRDCERRWHRERQADFQQRHIAENGKRYVGRTAAANSEKYAQERRDGLRPPKRHTSPAAVTADALRRARLAGVESGIEPEKFANREIFERDGWMCGICEKPVDSTLRYPDPGSASLDHIIPVSIGGGHTRSNVRCSHLRCNIARGASV